jgi:hypothetical protein
MGWREFMLTYFGFPATPIESKCNLSIPSMIVEYFDVLGGVLPPEQHVET